MQPKQASKISVDTGPVGAGQASFLVWNDDDPKVLLV
jgi:hypothetical protein